MVSPLPADAVTLSTLRVATGLTAQLVGLAVLTATLAALAAAGYRWYVRETVPLPLALLVGVGGLTLYLNVTAALGYPLGSDVVGTELEGALFTMVALAFGVGGAAVGWSLGDRYGAAMVLDRTLTDVDPDASELVRSVGRVLVVELPHGIDDVVGYDPVPDATKEALAGKRFVFPRDLSREELEERLVARLKTDYAVGHVDVEFAPDGRVTHLGVGSRAAGIGPTLPPATNAVCLRADPAFAASTGDIVQVWETDPLRRVLTAELRGVAGEYVTIAIDAADTPKLDPTREYRLVTLSVEDRPEREFAALLRAAPETFSSVTVEAGSPLHGMPVGALDVTIISVKPEETVAEPTPGPEYVLAPGDMVLAIGRPEALRRLSEAAEPLDPDLVRDIGKPTIGTADSSTETEPAAAADASGAAPDTEGKTTDPEPDVADPQAGNADAATTAAGGEAVIAGKADESSFQQLKAQFEVGELDEKVDADEAGIEDSGEAIDATAESVEEPAVSGESDEEGAEGEGASPASRLDADDVEGIDLEGETPVETEAGAEMDDPLDDDVAPLDIDDEDPAAGDLAAIDAADDGIEALDLGEEDDISGLDAEDDDEAILFEEGDEELDFGDLEDDTGADGDDGDSEADDGDSEAEDGESEADGGDSEADDGDSEEDDEDSSKTDDGGGGGMGSFQQLKEEFESGEADWADDISDSPGGDMRLEE